MIHEAVYDRLKDDADIAELVGARIFPQRAAQGVVLPCIVYQRVGTSNRFLHHTGTTRAALSRFQIDCWAKTPTKALEIAEAVMTIFHGWTGIAGSEEIYYSQVTNTQDVFDLDAEEYAVPVEVEIMHRETF